MPVAIRIAKAGTVILLNRLPTLTMSVTSSSSDFVYDLRTGTSTTPIKIEPPTHIEAHIKCTHVTRPSATAIIIFSLLAIYYWCCISNNQCPIEVLNIINCSFKQEVHWQKRHCQP